MNTIKYFILLLLLFTFLISCKKNSSPVETKILDEGGVPYERPENLVAELESVIGDHLYRTDSSVVVAGDSLYVIEISNITNPKIVSTLSLPNRATGLYVFNNIAYVSIANGQYPNHDIGGMQLIDIQDISNPYYLGFYSITDQILSISVIDSFALLAVRTSYPAGALQVISILDKRSPELLIQVDYENSPRSISIFHNLAYITFYGNELKIFDISNPREPKVISENNQLGFTNIHTTINSREYLVTKFIADKIYLVDVTNPVNPTKKSEVLSYSKEFFTRNNVLYTASATGVELFDIANESLSLKSGFKTNGIVESISVKDNFILSMVAIAHYDMILSPPRFQIFDIY